MQNTRASFVKLLGKESSVHYQLGYDIRLVKS